MLNHKCVECGVSFYMGHQGYLFVKTLSPLPHPLEKHNGQWYYLPYESLEELEKSLLQLQQELGDLFEHIKGGLSTTEERPYITFPLNLLLMRIVQRDVVNVIQNGELMSFIQPIISLQKNDELYGYESLLRTGGNHSITPGQLFSTAEKTGMLSLLDQRAREVAIQARKNFIQPGVKSFINFLPSTIYNPDFCLQHTFHLVTQYNIDPADLVFEVVETEKIEDINHLKNILYTYKREGMKVALDDVGAGFSTLETLKMLQPDYVKIDRHYVDHCDQISEKQSFLAQVMGIAKDLGIIVLAEGIERKEELEYCREIGIDLAQGYYIGKPALPSNIFIYGGK
ncbi:EAL domain-containing protein [Bacillus sp. 31A1R]|uniref:EAL domain-containing protein n=1 Tax=Robertmurraya mangrovi TaxID=3098077 RepID=A0ABU5ITM8_9BACI|nr:EAL domain-containing protein [Bacillus sp. 31A1R]MDZ5470502.1 EAL domain-containing protein [Bacillus sp. 31A1R]